jgi:high-affinity iron transporter
VLPTFVIGLREGVEASLIVGIIAAFLRQRGALRLLRYVWLGVGLATVLCLAVGVTLELVNQQLPQKQQEQLETVVAFIAVALVTSMIVWMAHHARALKGEIEERAGVALAAGSGGALVVMAFLAVMREGFETAVFLVAAFQSAANRASSVTGAALGLLVAIAIGFGIYKGGVHINLAKFFKATGLVLVLVAAGLVAFAMHTGHEAGWINFGQAQAVDLSWLIKPGSILSALLTGMLGIQPKPTVIEAIGWLAYFVPVSIYVLRPHKARPSRRVPSQTVASAA